MQSDGGLCNMNCFQGFKSILSGPAGGVIGYVDKKPLIGFDMGGTSTDVSRYSGQYEYTFNITAGCFIQAPQLDIKTVAAGGGSTLTFNVGIFKVGPNSVSAYPGPVCYLNNNSLLAITDANLILGRIISNYFPKIFGKIKMNH